MPRSRSTALRGARLELGRVLTRHRLGRAVAGDVVTAAEALAELALAPGERKELEDWQRLYVAGELELGHGITLGAAVKRQRDGRRGFALRRAGELVTAERGTQWLVLWTGEQTAYPVPVSALFGDG